MTIVHGEEKKSEKLGAGKVVVINDNRRRKGNYHTSNSMKGQQVFHDTESNSG
jgi:hypothetical protein